MELTLSENSPTQTHLLNSDGKPLYYTVTPSNMPRTTTKIFKCQIDEHGGPSEASEELARIHWHTIRSSRLIYNGEIVELSKFMPAKGIMK